MKKICPLLFLLLALCYVSKAQYDAAQSKVWAFGHKAGLNFTSGSPVAITTSIDPVNGTDLESCANVSDAGGNLLFYCTGNRVWDRSHNIMPQGSNILPASIYTDAASQGTVITPVPGDKNKYFIFSLEQASSPLTKKQCKLYYSVVDMTLNGGFGDIVPSKRGILLDSNLNEAMTTVQGDYCDVWVMVHGLNNRLFKAYHVTNMGISAPVLSNTGNFTGANVYISGAMKASPNRRRLVVCTNNYGSTPMSMGAEICDFNPATGNVSNAIPVDTSSPARYGVYSAAFSGDNTKLYLYTRSYTSSVKSVLQYDLSLPAANIITSKFTVHLKTGLSDMRLGPDGKIYMASDDSSRALDRINFPGLGGPACQYVQSAVILQSGTSTLTGLPNDYALVLPTDTMHGTRDTFICPATKTPVVLRANYNFNFFKWSNGSTADTMQVTDTGTYWLISNGMCDVRLDTFRVGYANPDTVRNKITADICTPNNTALVGPEGYLLYQWNDGNPNQVQIVNTSGTYWVLSAKDCGVRLDTFVMQTQVDLSFTLGNDTTICDPILLSVPLQDVTCRWQDGNMNQNYVVDHAGDYYVTVNKRGCSYTDTIHIKYNNIDQQMDDVLLCNETPVDVLLEANVPKGTTALWSDGSTGRELHVYANGKYWVTVTNGSCVKSDTATVNTGFCDCIISLPNAFTPNGDDKNDVFKGLLQPGCEFFSYSLVVYNRWGDRVFETKDPARGWDGTYNGREAVADVYMYVLHYTSGIKGKKQMKKGDVTLVR